MGSVVLSVALLDANIISASAVYVGRAGIFTILAGGGSGGGGASSTTWGGGAAIATTSCGLAAAIATSGYVMPIFPNGTCLQCFLSESNLETCDTVGVLNTITVSIASLQATLALKLLLGKEVESILYHYDIWNQSFKKINIKANKNCPTCAGNFTYLEKKETSKYIRFCSTGKYQVLGNKELDLAEIQKRWEKIGKVIQDDASLQFQNITLFKDGRALINANSTEEAEALYSKLVGN